jgi:uncharacterized protein YecE (DUF72 family)
MTSTNKKNMPPVRHICFKIYLMKGNTNKYLIGCSGYYYSQWRNSFYPPGLPASKWLQYYSKVFNTVELNSPFYRVPKLSAIKKQYDNTPGNFKFSVKVNRYITHILRLKNVSGQVKEFASLMQEGFSDKLHKLLFQLPPSFQYNDGNIELINNIDWGANSVIEFRHQSWWNKNTPLLLKKNKCTFCNVDFPGLETEFINTTKDFYLRLHGTPELFKSSYSRTRLEEFCSMMPNNSGTYAIYFNNTYYEAGFRNALELMDIIER